MPVEIPYPVTFNPYKHHFRFLRSEIEVWKIKAPEEVYSDLQKIGTNLTDLYIGELEASVVCEECLQRMQSLLIYSQRDLIEWLHPIKWKTILLSDGSEWIIKSAEESHRFLHIHPAKRSYNTIRVRATTLKTVLAMQIKEIQHPDRGTDVLSQVNHIRQTFLNLSPIKNLEMHNSGILHLWQFFLSSPKKFQL